MWVEEFVWFDFCQRSSLDVLSWTRNTDAWGQGEVDEKCLKDAFSAVCHQRWMLRRLFSGFPGGSDSKESACKAGDLGLNPGLGRSPGGGHGNPLQYSCLENPHGQRRLVGYGPWCHKESDATEWLTLLTHFFSNSFFQRQDVKSASLLWPAIWVCGRSSDLTWCHFGGLSLNVLLAWWQEAECGMKGLSVDLAVWPWASHSTFLVECWVKSKGYVLEGIWKLPNKRILQMWYKREFLFFEN